MKEVIDRLETYISSVEHRIFILLKEGGQEQEMKALASYRSGISYAVNIMKEKESESESNT